MVENTFIQSRIFLCCRERFFRIEIIFYSRERFFIIENIFFLSKIFFLQLRTFLHSIIFTPQIFAAILNLTEQHGVGKDDSSQSDAKEILSMPWLVLRNLPIVLAVLGGIEVKKVFGPSSSSQRFQRQNPKYIRRYFSNQ